jgi:hypothetical protein
MAAKETYLILDGSREDKDVFELGFDILGNGKWDETIHFVLDGTKAGVLVTAELYDVFLMLQGAYGG